MNITTLMIILNFDYEPQLRPQYDYVCIPYVIIVQGMGNKV